MKNQSTTHEQAVKSLLHPDHSAEMPSPEHARRSLLEPHQSEVPDHVRHDAMAETPSPGHGRRSRGRIEKPSDVRAWKPHRAYACQPSYHRQHSIPNMNSKPQLVLFIGGNQTFEEHQTNRQIKEQGWRSLPRSGRWTTGWRRWARTRRGGVLDGSACLLVKKKRKWEEGTGNEEAHSCNAKSIEDRCHRFFCIYTLVLLSF